MDHNTKAIELWSEEVSQTKENLFVKRLRACGFEDHEIMNIIDVTEGVCQFCWDADTGCQCWNDA